MHSPDNLLRAIADRPRDEAPRLVFADWLEEQGEADHLARAGAVRLQVRRKGLGGRARQALQAQARELSDAPPELLRALGKPFGPEYPLLDSGLALIAFLASRLGRADDRLKAGSVWVGALLQGR